MAKTNSNAKIYHDSNVVYLYDSSFFKSEKELKKYLDTNTGIFDSYLIKMTYTQYINLFTNYSVKINATSTSDFSLMDLLKDLHLEQKENM